jgi:hypothetical protein
VQRQGAVGTQPAGPRSILQDFFVTETVGMTGSVLRNFMGSDFRSIVTTREALRDV